MSAHDAATQGDADFVMVMPLLYGLGAKDHLDLAGYLILPCQKCGTTGPFAAFTHKRKVTFYGFSTVSIKEQFVIECRTCTQRFSVPPDSIAEFKNNLMSEQQLAAKMRQMSVGGAQLAAQGSGPTLYQILQVDPLAEPEVIEAAFRRLAIKYHPDTSTDPQASDKMRAILEAKEVLGDPAKRKAYNRSLGIVERAPAMRPEDI